MHLLGRTETMIDNILFDLDGTLTDPKDGITRCIQFALEEFDVEIPHVDQLTWCIGPPLRESFSRILNTTDGDIIQQAYLAYRRRFAEKGMFENFIYPEVLETLREIKESKFKVFLATSKPEIYAKQILEYFDISQFFDTAYGSNLDGSLTDKGELIAHILKSENLLPERTLIVGDRVYDIIGGKQNNIMTAAVTYGYGSQKEIDSSEPDFIFDAFSELLPFLEIAPTKTGCLSLRRVNADLPKFNL